MDRLTVTAPNTPATMTQARKKIRTSAPSAPSRRPQARPAAKTKMHRLNAEVVSVDNEKKTIPLRADGAEKTSPVGPIGVYTLKKLKPGDKVVLTCKDDAATGQHIEVAFIRLAPPEVPKSDAAAPPDKKE